MLYGTAMLVKIHFEILDRHEFETTFAYLQKHPKDIWNYEERVKDIFHENYDKRPEHSKEKTVEPNFTAHWTDDDILDTQVTIQSLHIIEYQATLRAGASDPRILVDLLRRCECVQEGLFPVNWTIQAWYQDTWTADTGNDNQLQTLLRQLNRENA